MQKNVRIVQKRSPRWGIYAINIHKAAVQRKPFLRLWRQHGRSIPARLEREKERIEVTLEETNRLEPERLHVHENITTFGRKYNENENVPA